MERMDALKHTENKTKQEQRQQTKNKHGLYVIAARLAWRFWIFYKGQMQ